MKRLAVSLGAALFAALLGAALLELGSPAATLAPLVAGTLAQSGVTHPVTAVLLNFRGYDTLLEIAVLLIALIGLTAVAHRGEAPAATAAAVTAARADLTLAEVELTRFRALVDKGYVYKLLNNRVYIGEAVHKDTIYLTVADADGMMVSLIQSNASGFGSHLVEPNTGINLHNRGIGFNLVEGHPAELGPRRRPPHTRTPALATRAVAFSLR